jgi:hypothetical protein
MYMSVNILKLCCPASKCVLAMMKYASKIIIKIMIEYIIHDKYHSPTPRLLKCVQIYIEYFT